MIVRTPLLYFLFALLFVLICTALLWPFIQLDDKIRDLALGYAEDYHSGKVNIRKVSLGFFHVTFNGIEIFDAEDKYIFTLEKVRIRYNPIRYFTEGFKPLGIITTVDIFEPEFDLRLDARSVNGSAARSDTTAFGWESVRRLPDYTWIKGINVEGAAFRLITGPTRRVVLFDNLDGKLTSERPGHLAGILTISPEKTNSTAKLEMKLDAIEEIIKSKFEAQINDFVFGSEFGMPDSLRILIDSLKTSFEFNIDGDSEILDGRADIYNSSMTNNGYQYFNGDSLKLIVNNWQLSIPPAVFHGLEGNWTLQATTPNLRQPKLDLRISASSDECSRLASDLGISNWITPSGKYDVQVIASGNILRPNVRFLGRLDQVILQSRLLEDIRFVGKWADNELDFEEVTFKTAEGTVLTKSKITPNLKEGIYSGQISWEGVLPTLKDALPGKLEAQFSVEHNLYSVWGRWQSDSVDTPPISMLMEYFTPDGRLTAELSTSNGISYSNLVITDLDKKPHLSLRVDNPFPMIQSIFPSMKTEQTDAMYLTGDFNGTLDSLRSTFDLFYPPTGSRFEFDGVARMVSQNNINYSGELVFQQENTSPLIGEVDLEFKEGLLTLHDLRLDDAISLNGSFDMTHQRLGFTELIISDWDIARGLTFFFPDFAAEVGGIIDGRLEIYGPVKNPNVMLNLYASRGRYKGQSDFWGVLSAKFENDVVHLEELNVGQSLASLMTAAGKIDVKNDSIDIQFISERADIADVMKLIGGNPLHVSGPLKFNAKVYGDLKDPDITINLKIEAGKIDKVPFESLMATASKDAFTDNKLKLHDFQMVQASDLAVSGEGFLPFGKTELDLKATVSGNILKIPHLIEGSILESSGRGKIDVYIKSTDDKLSFKQAKLAISDGHMKFSDVVNEINNINADIRLEGNQVKFYKFSGVVEGQKFTIGNYFISSEDSTEQQHLYFPSINLDLGVMTLYTEGRGLYATIPSLMVKGSMGYFRFTGKEPDKHFTVAGPIDNLHLDGEIDVSKTIVTYPFTSTGRKPSSFVRGFLATLEAATWNIKVIPERDNRYVREIKGETDYQFLEGMSDLLTTVDVDLTVNPALSNLQILGIIDAESFRMLGSLVATRGSIDYLDLNFKVDRFTVDFYEHDPYPWVEGRGEAVYIDSVGQTHDIFLTMYVIDPITGERERRGRWGDFVFVLEDESGSSQEQILAAMGYSPGQFTDKFTELSGEIVSNAVLRRWIRPIERELESWLNVDFIRLEPTIARHLFETEVLGVDRGPTSNISWGSYYLSDSQLSIGKYFTDDMFVIYTGVYESAIDAQNERRSGFLHRWSLEYRLRPISPNLVLDLGYEYDSLEQLRDRDINLRYWIL
ncbi:hypothetical protein KKA00_05945, partial [bacterium]|nr:hypothetical protein [bacterium]